MVGRNDDACSRNEYRSSSAASQIHRRTKRIRNAGADNCIAADSRLCNAGLPVHRISHVRQTHKSGGSVPGGIQKVFPNIEILLLPSDDKNDVSSYDYVGFASGIYAWDFGKPIYQKIEKLTGLEGKKCFSLCSSGAGSEKYIYYPKEAIEKKGGKFLRGYGCQGKANFFPLNMFGGVHGNKPDENDIKGAVDFVKKLVEENP